MATNDNNGENELLEAIRRKDADAWGRLINEYQGRLLNYATGKVKQLSDAEDAVQETFTSLLKVLQNPESRIRKLDSYLFMSLKNTICSQYRSKWSRSVTLLQDAYCNNKDGEQVDMIGQVTSGDMSVSRCISANEQDFLRGERLREALEDIVSKYKQSRNFRDLKVCDLLFYSGLSSNNAANILNQNQSSMRVFKHRFIKQLNQRIPDDMRYIDDNMPENSDVFFEIWESSRLTCPKHSTLKNFVRENLDPEWFDYIDFHLTTIGCHFCRASFKDIQQKSNSQQQKTLHDSIMTSTIGFFKS